MSSNPLLNAKTFEKASDLTLEKPMSISGTANKTILLLMIVIGVAFYAWNICVNGYGDKANLLLMGGAIAGLILALISAFKPSASPITAPAYAICEGFVVGVISYAYGKEHSGIIVNAIGITILALLSMLFLYKTGIIKASPMFKKVILTSTIAVGIFYIAGIIGAFLGHPMTIFNGGLLGIGVSLLFSVVAAFNFIIDFDFIEKGSQNNLPNYFEWYGGLSLLITLIWLYLEVLRLLAQLGNRN